MTSTAGPGFSLMSEGLGLAWMAEIPIVVAGHPARRAVNRTPDQDGTVRPAHRPEPVARRPEHPGDAPGTVEECFYAAIMAFNWAERYQDPSCCSASTPVRAPEEYPQAGPEQSPDRRQAALFRHQRVPALRERARIAYAGPRLAGAYVANGSEHDGVGDTTHQPTRHGPDDRAALRQVEAAGGRQALKRRTRTRRSRSCRGEAQRAGEGGLRAARCGRRRHRLGLHHVPQPSSACLAGESETEGVVLVPELNYLGQFSSVLRSRGVRAESITQYTGLPFKVRDIVKRVRERVGATQREGVAV